MGNRLYSLSGLNRRSRVEMIIEQAIPVLVTHLEPQSILLYGSYAQNYTG